MCSKYSQRVLFDCARPRTELLTTPNIECSIRLDALRADRLRCKYHRFEWTSAVLQDWLTGAVVQSEYTFRFAPVAPEASEVGSWNETASVTLGGNGGFSNVKVAVPAMRFVSIDRE